MEELPPNLQLLSLRRETADTIILRLTANILQMLTYLEFTFSFLRLEHSFQINEHPTLSQPASYRLSKYER